MAHDELLHKWINGTLTEEELNTFKARPEYEDLVKVYAHTAHLQAPSLDQEAMLKQILAMDKSEQPAPIDQAKVVGFRRWWPIAMAAAITLIVGIWFGLRPAPEPAWTATATVGQHPQGQLPDQSTYMLNAGSRLAFDAANWADNREVQLEGEAYFSVEKGTTFTVSTAHGAVQVLGTRFNVRDRDGSLMVSCHSGKVAVKNQAGKVIATLTPQQGVRLKGEQFIPFELMDQEVPSWTQGRTEMSKATAPAIVAELARQYDIEVEAKGLNTQQLYGTTFPHDELKSALEIVAKNLELSYTLDPSTKKVTFAPADR